MSFEIHKRGEVHSINGKRMQWFGVAVNGNKLDRVFLMGIGQTFAMRKQDALQRARLKGVSNLLDIQEGGENAAER